MSKDQHAESSRALDLFTATYGYSPAGVWSAPGRVNVIGEHTDYNAGFVLPMAIDRYTHVAAAPRTDGVLRMISSGGGGQAALIALADLSPGRSAEPEPAEPAPAAPEASAPGAAGVPKPATAKDATWTAYPAGIAWVLREAGFLPAEFAGADLAFSSTVPVGAGLSSSAALECATALALTGLAGAEPTAGDLARLAQQAENDYVGMPCGPLDQLASSFGEDGSVLFIDTRNLAITPFPFDLAQAELTLLVCDTRAQHDLGDSGYPERRGRCEKAAAVLGLSSLRELGAHEAAAQGDAAVAADGEPTEEVVERALEDAREHLDEISFRRVRHVVTENARVRQFVALLGAGALDEERAAAAGRLMTASHYSLRDDYEVSCEELDVVVEAALQGGALGARMTGGGFGGSAIALVPLALVDQVTESVRTALPQVEFFAAVAARGAHRTS
ncbi:MAG TPA: galactokinase [Actinocrinis sp.]|nr:galactokinase [Actinocrinis sp.]